MTFDCLLFYGDLLMLELRLSEHRHFIDVLIVQECRYDHRNLKKRTYKRRIENLCKQYGVGLVYSCTGKWSDKLMKKTYGVSNYKRDMLKKTLIRAGVQDDDVVIMTDLDEILSRKRFKYRKNGIQALQFKNYYYYVNLYRCMWINGFVAQWKDVKDKRFSWLRYNYHKERRKYDTGLLKNVGWHFGWAGGVDVILDKYRNFKGLEQWPAFLEDREAVSKMLQDRLYFGDMRELELVSIDKTYPDALRFNLNKYNSMIYDYGMF